MGRLILAMPGGLVAWVLLGNPNLFFGIAIYLTLRVMFVRLTRIWPDAVTGWRAALGLAIGAGQGVAMVGIIYACWTLAPTLGPICAVLALLAVATATASSRVEVTFLTYVDIAAEAVSILMLPLLFHLDGAPPHETAVMAIICSTVAVVFLVSMQNTIRARFHLRDTIRSEVEQSRLRVLGQLTGGVAHDFNNLLTVILGNIELFRMDSSDTELLDQAEDAGQKAARLTAQLLAFSRKSDLKPKAIALSKPVHGAVALARRLIPPTIHLRVDVDEFPQRIFVDPDKLEPVVLNLLINARDAMPDGGAITVSARYAPGHSPRLPAMLRGRDCAVLTVTDTGTGIPPELLERVTEPYFTTKDVGKGSGLGLSMAKGVVEQSGGALTIDSIVGEGTTIRIWLPVMDQAVAASVSERSASEAVTVH